MEPMCLNKGLHWQFNTAKESFGGAVIVDRIRLNQIALNILSNAAKYTPECGEITYTSKSHLGSDGKFILAFEVKDTGIGMSEEFQKHMFEEFSQEYDNSQRPKGITGTGLGLAIVKISLISVIAYNALANHLTDLFLLYELELNQAVALVGDLTLTTGLRISLVYLLVGVVDLIYQRMKFKKDNKMTKQEVKDEYKDAEGDPQIKGQIKQRMREASQRRMMQDVPKADVVITNPTHLAVAIMYNPGETGAPVVVAKGADFLAERIKEEAIKHHILIRENVFVARSLYATCDIGEEIPPEMYEVVATILADLAKFRNSV